MKKFLKENDQRPERSEDGCAMFNMEGGKVEGKQGGAVCVEAFDTQFV